MLRSLSSFLLPGPVVLWTLNDSTIDMRPACEQEYPVH